MPQLITLDTSHVADCLRLSDQAGWNQVAADWELLLAPGHAFGFADRGKLVATALVFPYPPEFAWISMVLVDEEWRRQGLASQLMRACLDRAEYLGLAPVLDATPAGRPVYERLGFVAGERIVRMEWRGFRHAPRREVTGGEDGAIRPATDDDIKRLSDWDAVRFGANRSRVLRALRRRIPGAAFVCEQEDEIRGFVLARDGRRATQIGPLIADDDDLAIVLVEAARDGLLADLDSNSVTIDATADRVEFVEHLETRGFTSVREFTRMANGIDLPLVKPTDCFATGGPELG